MNPLFKVQLFGPTTISVYEANRPRLLEVADKTEHLFALLVLRAKRPVRRQWLAETLWPYSDPEMARSNLRERLHDLRQALGSAQERLIATNNTVVLDLEETEVDLLAFDNAIVGKNRPSLERAIALYKGPLLEDCNEEWVFQERIQREQGYYNALRLLADLAMGRHDYREAVAYLRKARLVDPYDETVVRSLLEALARSNNWGEISAVYRPFRRLIFDTFRHDVSVETSALYQSLCAKMPARLIAFKSISFDQPVSPPPRFLPEPLTPLLGRAQEVQQIEELLVVSRLVTLTGSGGVGKTRLALQVAHEIVDDYSHGAWFVDLSSLTNPTMFSRSIAGVLQVREEPARPISETLHEHLQSRQLLLILDNCEHLRETCAQQIALWLQACPGLRVLVTSRVALGLSGVETVWRVPALALPELERVAFVIEGLADYVGSFEGIQLFIARARAVRPSFSLTERNVRLVATLCHRVEGIPLAIELVAAQVKNHTLSEIAAQLKKRLSLWSVDNPIAIERQKTLKDTMDWSYGLLEESERALLKRLSVFVGPFTEEAAQYVCGEAEDIQPGLHRLLDHSLVHREEREERSQFVLLNSVRQYAWELLLMEGGVEVYRDRHLAFYAREVSETAQKLASPEQAEALEYLDYLYPNLWAAMEWCLQGDAFRVGQGLEMATAIWRWHWFVRGYPSEGRELLRSLLTAADSASEEIRREAWRGVGLLSYAQCDYPAALEALTQSLRISERSKQMDGKRSMAMALNGLGLVYWRLGDYSQARDHFIRRQVLCRDLEDARLMAYGHLNMGNVNWSEGDLKAARVQYEAVLRMFRDTWETDGTATTLTSLAVIERMEGNYLEAHRLLEESQVLFTSVNDKRGLAQVCNNRGLLEVLEGDYAAAEAHLQEGILLCQKQGDIFGVLESLDAFCSLALAKQEFVRAAYLWESSAAGRERLKTPYSYTEQKERDEDLQTIQARLPDTPSWEVIFQEARRWTQEQVIAFALSGKSMPEMRGGL